MPRRTTGPGPCARRPTAPCCAGSKMVRWWSSPMAPATHPRLKARLMATGQEGTFGESGERISAAVEDTPSNSRELLARVDFAPGTDAGMESMLGFRQDLGFAGSVQSVAAVALHPEMDSCRRRGAGRGCLPHLGNDPSGRRIRGRGGFRSGAGPASARASSDTVAAVLPFASVGWRERQLHHSLPHDHFDARRSGRGGQSKPGPGSPRFRRATALWPSNMACIRRLGWERRTDLSGIAVLFYADRIDNPVIEAMGQLCRWRFRSRQRCFLDQCQRSAPRCRSRFLLRRHGGHL